MRHKNLVGYHVADPAFGHAVADDLASDILDQLVGVGGRFEREGRQQGHGVFSTISNSSFLQDTTAIPHTKMRKRRWMLRVLMLQVILVSCYFDAFLNNMHSTRLRL